jgi:hypothetical protein
MDSCAFQNADPLGGDFGNTGMEIGTMVSARIPQILYPLSFSGGVERIKNERTTMDIDLFLTSGSCANERNEIPLKKDPGFGVTASISMVERSLYVLFNLENTDDCRSPNLFG